MTKTLSEMENILAFFEAFQSGKIKEAKELLGKLDLSSVIPGDRDFHEGELAAKLRGDSGHFLLKLTLINSKTLYMFVLLNKVIHAGLINQIKKTDRKGDTALHLAVREEHVDLVRILVKLDDSLCECANREGETPLKLAVRLGFDEAVEFLVTRTSNALHLIVELNQVELVEYLMEKKKKVDLSKLINLPYQQGEQLPNEKSSTNASGDGGDKPSESAAGNRNKPEEKKCTKADNTQEDQPLIVLEGDTPLHIAARNKYEDMVNLLLKVDKVDKFAVNSEDKTPFDIAREVTEYHESFRSIRRLRVSERRPKQFMYCTPQVSHMKFKNAMKILNKAYEERRNSELVVAALLATMTCAALFTVPGGFQSESHGTEDEGSPLLIARVSFKLFIVFDCIAFFLSLFVCIMWEMSSELTTENKMVFMTVNTLVVCLSFGFSAFGFMCAVYTMIEHKVKTFSWVVLGSLIFITLCGVLAFIHQFIHFVVKRARANRLCGVSLYFDEIVEKVWRGAERSGLLKLCRLVDEASFDLITGHCKFKSDKGVDSSNKPNSSPSCCCNHV